VVPFDAKRARSGYGGCATTGRVLTSWRIFLLRVRSVYQSPAFRWRRTTTAPADPLTSTFLRQESRFLTRVFSKAGNILEFGTVAAAGTLCSHRSWSEIPAFRHWVVAVHPFVAFILPLHHPLPVSDGARAASRVASRRGGYCDRIRLDVTSTRGTTLRRPAWSWGSAANVPICADPGAVASQR
jgi:hypothetical protein